MGPCALLSAPEFNHADEVLRFSTRRCIPHSTQCTRHRNHLPHVSFSNLATNELILTPSSLCIDLLRKNALVSRVWFEAVWVGFFWIAQLGACCVFGGSTLLNLSPGLQPVPLLRPPFCPTCYATLHQTFLFPIPAQQPG